MSTTFSTSVDVHSLIPQTDCNTNRFVFFTKPLKQQQHNKKFITFCSNNNNKTTKRLQSNEPRKTPSLSDQLQPLSTTTLSNEEKAPLLSSKPKSIWVNPTKPKRSVLSLQRQKKSPYSYNPKIAELRAFAKKLNDCENSEEAFIRVLNEIPEKPNRENVLTLLNSLKPWQKTILFFDWVKKQDLFPMETIFYNVTMKSLRFDKQFPVMEELANEMVSNEIPLDNITYSTIITCAKRCNLFDKAIEWFERMYKTGLMPDEVTYSAVLDVYAKLGKVEEVLSLYERGVASGWKPDAIAFSVLGKMFGENGDYDGIRYVLQEMKSLGVQPNLVVFNTLLEGMGKARKPGLARSMFDEMVEAGVTPNERTLTSLIKIYGKARWGRDALELWERMKANKWPMDFILYNTLLNMCADIGLVEEAEKLFEDMKLSKRSKPDGWSYTAMLNIYGSAGEVDKAMDLFKEMSDSGIALNVMGSTCLIQSLGKARRFDDFVRVFEVTIEQGIKPDDRFCGSLLSVVSLCENDEDRNKVISCLQIANPKLVEFLSLIQQKDVTFETVKERFRSIINSTAVEARRPFCNCLIDISRSKNLQPRAHELLYLGTLYGLYPSLHNKTASEWKIAGKTAMAEIHLQIYRCSIVDKEMLNLANYIYLNLLIPPEKASKASPFVDSSSSFSSPIDEMLMVSLPQKY
ncbi:hypothetical protein ACFE04_015479 [Oxalis oulophora]